MLLVCYKQGSHKEPKFHRSHVGAQKNFLDYSPARSSKTRSLSARVGCLIIIKSVFMGRNEGQGSY